MNTPILILAAGSSSRLGKPKQMLPFKKSTLLEHVIGQCLESRLGSVYVVLGAYQKEIKMKLSGIDCTFIHNPAWEDGMGSSISCAMKEMDLSNAEGIFIVLSDQPFISKALLQQLRITQKETQALIVNSRYSIGQGPPTYFDKSHFKELAGLEGIYGAKSIIDKYSDQVENIFFEKGNIDIDTQDDLKWLI